MQNAECRMQNDLIPLRYTHKENYMNAERGARSAERLHYTTFRSQGKVHITNYLDFAVWMQYTTKVKQQRVAVLMYCALKGFCL